MDSQEVYTWAFLGRTLIFTLFYNNAVRSVMRVNLPFNINHRKIARRSGSGLSKSHLIDCEFSYWRFEIYVLNVFDYLNRAPSGPSSLLFKSFWVFYHLSWLRSSSFFIEIIASSINSFELVTLRVHLVVWYRDTQIQAENLRKNE